MRYELNGISYEADIIGEGLPLLMLHGFTGSKETWKPFYPIWQESCRLISVDIIGHGESASPADNTKYQTENVIRDFLFLLDTLEIEKINILGYSMGGRLALSFAVMFPERVSKIILESASPGLKTEQERQERRRQDAELAEQIKENGIEWFVDKWEHIPLFSTQKSLPDPVKNALRKQRLNNNPVGLANSLLGMGTGAQPSWWSQLETLNIPTMLLTGELDKKFCQIAKEMSLLMPYAKNKNVFQAGHAIHMEQPEIFGKIVREFLFNT